MRLKLAYPVVMAICAVVACSDSSTDTPAAGVDAGLDAARTVPTSQPPPVQPGDDDDDVIGGDDDDVSPSDAGSDAAPKDAGKDAAPKDAGPLRYRVFITKAKFTGNLGGLDGADAKCTAAATTANLGGTWKAWVSTTLKNAGDRIVDRSPWYLVDRSTVVFETFAGLMSPPKHKIDTNETGSISQTGNGPLTNRVWTGTTNGGVLAAGKACADWLDDTQGKGVAGAHVEPAGSSSPTNWTRYALQPDEACTSAWPIYCFEQ